MSNDFDRFRTATIEAATAMTSFTVEMLIGTVMGPDGERVYVDQGGMTRAEAWAAVFASCTVHDAA